MDLVELEGLVMTIGSDGFILVNANLIHWRYLPVRQSVLMGLYYILV